MEIIRTASAEPLEEVAVDGSFRVRVELCQDPGPEMREVPVTLRRNRGDAVIEVLREPISAKAQGDSLIFLVNPIRVKRPQEP